jgi:K+ transporter
LKVYAISPDLASIHQNTIIYIVIGIMVILFAMQQFGSAGIGKLFGPIMFVWFAMLAVRWALAKYLNTGVYSKHLIQSGLFGF